MNAENMFPYFCNKTDNPIKNKDARDIIMVACICVKPRSTKRWWTCLLSATKGERPLTILIVNTLSMSVRGIAKKPIAATGENLNLKTP